MIRWRGSPLGHNGMTLIELMAALTILSILIMPFLGLFTHLASINANSRTLYKTGMAAQNKLESLKALSYPALYEQAASGLLQEGDYHYRIAMWVPEILEGDQRGYEIVMKEEAGSLTSYIRHPDESAPLIFSSSLQQQPIRLEIIRGTTHLTFCYSNDQGNNVVKTSPLSGEHHFFTLYLNEKPREQTLQISFIDFEPDALTLFLYHGFFVHGEVGIILDQQEYKITSLYHWVEEEKAPFTAISTNERINLPTGVRVETFQSSDLLQPVNSRTGILQLRQ